VQVKGTDCREGGGDICHLAGSKLKAYTAKQIDYFAIYLLREDIWHIFPAKRLMGQNVVMLSPHRGASVHERYKEAWNLLDSREHVSIRAAKAAADKVLRKRGRPNHNGAAGDRPRE
jgi:hypothetical protein